MKRTISIKIITLISLLCSVSFAGNETLDSLLISQKAFLPFVAVNRANFPTLDYQLHIKKLIPLMEKNKFDIRSALVLDESLVKKFIAELKGDDAKIIDLIEIQRYATLDNTKYFRALIQSYKRLRKNSKIYDELKNALLNGNLDEKECVEIASHVSISDTYLLSTFNEYVDGKKEYNRFAFRVLSKLDSQYAIFFLSKFMEDEKPFLKTNLSDIVYTIHDNKLLDQFSSIIDSSVGTSIMNDILIQSEKTDTLKIIYNELHITQKIKFCDMLVQNIIKSGEHDTISGFLASIEDKDLTMNLLRYKIAEKYRAGGDIFAYSKQLIENNPNANHLLYEMAIYQLFSKKYKINEMALLYKERCPNDDYKFTIWENFNYSLTREKKAEIYSLLIYSLSLNIKDFHQLAQKIKKSGIDKKVMISFLESRYYKVTYEKDDLQSWYTVMKFLEYGTAVMLASEDFFFVGDLMQFYQMQLTKEEDENWKFFLENRIHSLL